jgi:hypothetical protein
MFSIGARWAEAHPTVARGHFGSRVAAQKPLNAWLTMLILAALISAGPLYEMRLLQANATLSSNSHYHTVGSWHTEAPSLTGNRNFRPVGRTAFCLPQ